MPFVGVSSNFASSPRSSLNEFVALSDRPLHVVEQILFVGSEFAAGALLL
jgi:hypothetical protein